MKKNLLLLLLVPALLLSCLKESQDDYQEPEYKILSYTEDGAILCTFSYPSIDSDGNPIKLSSALFAYNPSQTDSSSVIKSVIISCHITVTSGAECPSKAKASSSINDVTVMESLPKTSLIPELKQSVIIMPDLEGYGITEHRSHPYLSKDLCARQTADAVKYGLMVYRNLEKALPFADDWKSFCLGFSQGGAIALATQRYIEENALDEEIHFTGSFCGDGPYDLISTLRYYIMDDGTSSGVETGHTPGTLSMPVVLPLIVKGMLDSHPDMKKHNVTDYLSKQFLDTGIIEWLAEKNMSTKDIAKSWYNMIDKGLTAKDGTRYSPGQMQSLFTDRNVYKSFLLSSYQVTADLSKMLTPDLYAYLCDTSNYENGHSFTGDKYGDLMAALESNSNISGWEPAHKIIMLHSRYDTVVPYDNLKSFTGAHPDAAIRVRDYGTKDHEDTGTNFCLALLNKTFSADLAWLFAEK